jgi:hypothetical protein
MDQRLKTYGPLVAAVVLAAILQTYLIARSGTVSADSIIFVSIAHELADHPIETLRAQDQHPGFPAVLLVSARVANWLGVDGEPEVWIVGGRIVTFACGLLAVWVVWLLGRDLFDLRIANLGALIFVLLPLVRSNAADGQSDATHLLFYLTAAWLGATAISDGKPLRLALAGLASGVAYWIRPEGLEVALVLAVCLIARGAYAHWGLMRTAAATCALAGMVLVVVAPYWVLAGKFTSKQIPFAKLKPTGTYIAQEAEHEAAEQAKTTNVSEPPRVLQSSEPPIATAQPSGESATVEPATANPRYSAALLFRLLVRADRAFITSVCQGFKFTYLPFYLVGITVLLRRGPAEWTPLVFLLLLAALHIVLLHGVFVMAGYIAHRHVLPLMGLAAPYVAYGVVVIGEWVASRARVPARYCVAAAMGLSVALVLPFTLKPFNREFLPVIEATYWVESRIDRGAGIVSNSPYPGFYSDLPVAELGTKSWSLDEALAIAPPAARYDYVVLHVGAHRYQSEWLQQVQTRYHQVLSLDDPYATAKHPRKVLVFEANDLEARRAERPARS